MFPSTKDCRLRSAQSTLHHGPPVPHSGTRPLLYVSCKCYATRATFSPRLPLWRHEGYGKWLYSPSDRVHSPDILFLACLPEPTTTDQRRRRPRRIRDHRPSRCPQQATAKGLTSQSLPVYASDFQNHADLQPPVDKRLVFNLRVYEPLLTYPVGMVTPYVSPPRPLAALFPLSHEGHWEVTP